MDVDQEQRYVCKFCNKNCFTGKSLGGHMRCHLDLISSKKVEESENDNLGFEGCVRTSYGLRGNPKKVLRVSGPSSDPAPRQKKVKNLSMGFQDDEQLSYGLRENPKKSWKVSDPKFLGSTKENVCKECGKVFPSERALSGHLRCHSVKKIRGESVCKKCGKVFDSMRALFGHMRSHPKKSEVADEEGDDDELFVEGKSRHEMAAICPIRGKRSKTRYKVTPSPSYSDLNASSCDATETDHQVEEVAMCLMMMSRGVRNWDGFSDSVLFEGNSEKWGGRKFLDFVLGSPNVLVEKNTSEVRNFGSGSDTENKAELEDSADKLAYQLVYDTEIEKGVNSVEAEVEKEFEFVGIDEEFLTDSVTKREYKCKTCGMSFYSFRALGGHTNRHKRDGSGLVRKVESEEKIIQANPLSDLEADSKMQCNVNSLEQETNEMVVTSYELKKGKEHECSICFKVFVSGQALGGHKRAHFVEMAESRAKEAMLVKQEVPGINNLFDLNFPENLDAKGDDEDFGLNPWWVGSGHDVQPLGHKHAMPAILIQMVVELLVIVTEMVMCNKQKVIDSQHNNDPREQKAHPKELWKVKRNI
ncbi:hypothetical protein RJ640_002099 [Escallonia rubra]|uniref:C2H2-type domain-containing protein n=1 Tax=Escallonia rubra TaxID=112253 RepID=A0AA88UQ79_9ASTE|nr:hypothetical protein RJ640_002099 [Escallonia rubra]